MQVSQTGNQMLGISLYVQGGSENDMVSFDLWSLPPPPPPAFYLTKEFFLPSLGCICPTIPQ